MKKIITQLTITLLIFMSVKTASANGEEAKNKRVNPFSINKRTIDSSLSDGTAKILVTFYANGEKFTQSVNVGMNNESFYRTPDISGNITLNAKKGKYKLYFHVGGYVEVITDSVKVNNQEIVETTVRFYAEARNDVQVKKPVIYVYPEEKMDVQIKLDVNGKLGFTWPVYHESWNFTASPEGIISMDNKEYNYLFWESEMPEYALDKMDNTGFLVATDTLLSFLENSLDQMGFNSKESADFITFWYPLMMGNEKNHIQFLFNESCDTYAQLNITPQPDQIYRVGMIWKNATTDFIPEPQIIPVINREGFTVIEWGGMESELLFINEN
jgi:hypothetical protein